MWAVYNEDDFLNTLCDLTQGEHVRWLEEDFRSAHPFDKDFWQYVQKHAPSIIGKDTAGQIRNLNLSKAEVADRNAHL